MKINFKGIILILICVLMGKTNLNSQIRFEDNFEGDFNPNPSNQVYDQWYESGWSDGDGLAISSEISPRNGIKCVKAIMYRNTGGKSRSEIGVNLDKSLGDYWCGFSIYIPNEIDFSKVVTDGSWHAVLAQWGVWLNNPGLPDFALRMNESNFRLTYEPSTGSPIVLFETEIVQGRWVDWVFHIDWTRESNGIFEVWQDQVQIFTKADFQTTDGEGDDVKSKIGLYYSGWGNHSSELDSIYCYYDAYKIAQGPDQLLNVAPWAAGSSETAPNGLTTEGVSKNQIELNWYDNSSDELGFIIERKSADAFIEIARVDSNITAYSDTGLPPSTFYIYRISAFNEDGVFGHSNESSAETFTVGGVYQEKDGIISIEAENGELGEVWQIENMPSSSNGKFVELNPSYNNRMNTPECILPSCILSYYFKVNNAGNYRLWLRLLSEGEESDSFFWRLDDGEWNKENYELNDWNWYSSDNAQIDKMTEGNHILEIGYGTNGIKIDKLVIQPYNFPNITDYGPLESNGTGIAPPKSPSGLVVNAVSEKQINLTWTDNSSTEEGFKVERKIEASSFWTIATTDSNVTSIEDKFLLNPSTIYTYRVSAFRSQLRSNYSNLSADTTLEKPVDVASDINFIIDDKLNLSQNYPNPANPSTVIEFTIPIEKGKKSNIAKNVRIDIFDSLGKRISTLLNENKYPGTHSILFNGSSSELDLSSGIYFYKLSYDDQSITKKLMFLK